MIEEKSNKENNNKLKQKNVVEQKFITKLK